jgi:hypothetical protein
MKIEIDVAQFAKDIKTGKSIGGANNIYAFPRRAWERGKNRKNQTAAKRENREPQSPESVYFGSGV